MDELISIIVPIYNVQKYLCKCVESIMNQTYRNIEIILVDDGSTDGSEEICDEMSKTDDRIIVIHQRNKGVSEARNKGIEEAKGKYIGFIDGDDYIDEDMFEKLYKEIKKYGADIAVCGFYRESEKKIEVRSCGFTGDLNRDEAYKALFAGKIGTSSCNKLFKRELFQKIKYKKIYQGEDLEVLYRTLGNSSRVVCTSAVSYHVVYRKGSASNSPFNNKRMDMIYVLEDMIVYIQKVCPEVLKEAYAFQLKNILNMVEYMYMCMKEDNFASRDEYKNYKSCVKTHKKYLYDTVRRNVKFYWNNSSVYIGDYILFLGFLFHVFRPVYFLLNKGVHIYHAFKR